MFTVVEPRHEKTCLRDVRPGKTQTSLLNYKNERESWNCKEPNWRYYTVQTANNKGADQTARMRRLISAFVVCTGHKAGFLVTWLINMYRSQSSGFRDREYSQMRSKVLEMRYKIPLFDRYKKCKILMTMFVVLKLCYSLKQYIYNLDALTEKMCGEGGEYYRGMHLVSHSCIPRFKTLSCQSVPGWSWFS